MNELHGQAPEATHIFPRLFESEMFVMNGEDFSTPDGTCIRDYIHVQDIADAHIKAIEKRATGIINLGSNSGFSNLDIVKAVGINTWRVDARRHGDCDSLIADNGLAKSLLGWTPTYDLQGIVNSLRVWYDSDNYKELKNG
jgi:UDP-glucose 4-epimerase